MKLNRDELLWITNALNEVLHGPIAIAEWEFGTRMGGSVGEVTALLARVNTEVETLPKGHPDR